MFTDNAFNTKKNIYDYLIPLKNEEIYDWIRTDEDKGWNNSNGTKA